MSPLPLTAFSPRSHVSYSSPTRSKVADERPMHGRTDGRERAHAGGIGASRAQGHPPHPHPTSRRLRAHAAGRVTRRRQRRGASAARRSSRARHGEAPRSSSAAQQLGRAHTRGRASSDGAVRERCGSGAQEAGAKKDSNARGSVNSDLTSRLRRSWTLPHRTVSGGSAGGRHPFIFCSRLPTPVRTLLVDYQHLCGRYYYAVCKHNCLVPLREPVSHAAPRIQNAMARSNYSQSAAVPAAPSAPSALQHRLGADHPPRLQCWLCACTDPRLSLRGRFRSALRRTPPPCSASSSARLVPLISCTFPLCPLQPSP
eukprot:470044-Prymnesium_polylepis.1